MNDLTVDLHNDVLLIIPVDDGEPRKVDFTRMDIERPGCVVFYWNDKKNPDDQEKIACIIPWANINTINFQSLTE